MVSCDNEPTQGAGHASAVEAKAVEEPESTDPAELQPRSNKSENATTENWAKLIGRILYTSKLWGRLYKAPRLQRSPC